MYVNVWYVYSRSRFDLNVWPIDMLHFFPCSFKYIPIHNADLTPERSICFSKRTNVFFLPTNRLNFDKSITVWVFFTSHPKCSCSTFMPQNYRDNGLIVLTFPKCRLDRPICLDVKGDESICSAERILYSCKILREKRSIFSHTGKFIIWSMNTLFRIR